MKVISFLASLTLSFHSIWYTLYIAWVCSKLLLILHSVYYLCLVLKRIKAAKCKAGFLSLGTITILSQIILY